MVATGRCPSAFRRSIARDVDRHDQPAQRSESSRWSRSMPSSTSSTCAPASSNARTAPATTSATRRADALVSVGGGTQTTGLAKAIALDTGLPIVAVPTTYAGSEATDVSGLTADGRKTTGVDPRVLPRAVVYDAALLVSLPVRLAWRPD